MRISWCERGCIECERVGSDGVFGGEREPANSEGVERRVGLGGRIRAVPEGMGVLVARRTLGGGGIAHNAVGGGSGLDPLPIAPAPADLWTWRDAALLPPLLLVGGAWLSDDF